MCGPSGSEKEIEASGQGFGQMLQSNYGDLFSEQQGVLANINAALKPIVAAGPSQQGYSPAETAALNTQAINSTAAANRNAQVAAGTAAAGQGGGGSSGLTSGIQSQIRAGIASASADTLANQQTGIVKANYDQGNQNYWRAQGAMSQLGSEYNPNGAQSGAISQNQAAFQQASQITTENNAVGQDVAGFLTAAAGSAGDVAKALNP